jgi:HTH-type transcriptional regulator, sugar sensing transcriptional regulator
MSATPDTRAKLVEQLMRLGFSQYEAKAYLGLLMAGAQTGYGLSKVTDVPQPKLYETLRRLVDRRAAVQVSEEPARFAAVPAERLLVELEQEYLGLIGDARDDLNDLPAGSGELPLVGTELEGIEAVIRRANETIEVAEAKVYLSGRTEELAGLEAALMNASQRDVELVMLHFGRKPFPVPRGSSFGHISTAGRIYRRHQARHLALVVDSRSALWALARDGTDWRGMFADDPLFAAALKGYIRHDIYIQRIYGDLGDELRALYGQSLEGLTDLSSSSAHALDGLPEEPEGGDEAVAG